MKSTKESEKFTAPQDFEFDLNKQLEQLKNFDVATRMQFGEEALAYLREAKYDERTKVFLPLSNYLTRSLDEIDLDSCSLIRYVTLMADVVTFIQEPKFMMIYNNLQKGVKANFLKRCLVRPFAGLVTSVQEKRTKKE